MKKTDPIKNEWNQSAIPWSDFIREGKDYYRDELNNPATFKLIGDVRGQRVLDVACGEGYNTRILARKGAKVTGVDFSEKLIDLAKQEEAKEELGISYYVLDAADLNKEFSSNYFDLVTCFMALQDIKHYKKVIFEVDRVLKKRGRFICSIPHPCFSKIVVNGKKISTTTRYFGSVKHPIRWDMERLDTPFKTTSFHRTLTDYFEALHKSKLFVARLVEPRPTQQGLLKYPPLREVLVIPQSIIIEAVKIADK